MSFDGVDDDCGNERDGFCGYGGVCACGNLGERAMVASGDVCVV